MIACGQTRSTGALVAIIPIYFTVHKIARNLWGAAVVKDPNAPTKAKTNESKLP